MARVLAGFGWVMGARSNTKDVTDIGLGSTRACAIMVRRRRRTLGTAAVLVQLNQDDLGVRASISLRGVSDSTSVLTRRRQEMHRSLAWGVIPVVAIMLAPVVGMLGAPLDAVRADAVTPAAAPQDDEVIVITSAGQLPSMIHTPRPATNL